MRLKIDHHTKLVVEVLLLTCAYVGFVMELYHVVAFVCIVLTERVLRVLKSIDCRLRKIEEGKE